MQNLAWVVEIIDWLKRWQTLVGAFIGAASGLLVALVMARSARHREEVVGALLVSGDLAEPLAFKAECPTLWAMTGRQETEYAGWLVERFLHRWPPLSPLFAAEALRVMPVNVELAAHLVLFQKLHREMRTTIEEVRHLLSVPELSTAARDELNKRIRRLVSGFDQLTAHASCATCLITGLILSRAYLFHRVRRWVWKTQQERQCRELLTAPQRAHLTTLASSSSQ